MIPVKQLKILLLFILGTIFLQNCCTGNISSKSNKISDEFMELSAELTINTNANFELTARRIQIKDDEYLPNSEDFRVEIYDNSGNLIFNSNYQKNYFMAIMKVKPEQSGDVYIYKYSWDYTNNFGKKVPKGEYSAKLIIPAEPKNYSVNLNFQVDY
jgi:hypothetical protein